MRPDPVLVISICLGLFIVTFSLLLQWAGRITYKRLRKYYIVRIKQMSDDEKVDAVIAIGFAVVYGIMLYGYMSLL
jgi:uncharacterized membrane protein YidH (DUF202 family)